MSVRVTTKITYSVPEGHVCNLPINGSLTKRSTELCRFAVKTKYGYTCALYNDVLELENTKTPRKSRSCIKAMCGYDSVVEQVPDVPQVDPAALMKLTINEYTKVVRQLRQQGYPESMAETLAKQYMLGGN